MLCLLGMLVQPLNPVEYYICNGLTFSKFHGHGHGKGLACSKLFVGLASYDLLTFCNYASYPGALLPDNVPKNGQVLTMLQPQNKKEES